MGNEMIRNMAVQAKSGGLLAVEQFLQDNYLFRRNVLNGKVEYVTLPVEGEPQYREMTPEALMSIIIRARKELADEKCNPKTDIQDLLRSEEVRSAPMGWAEPRSSPVLSTAWTLNRAASFSCHLAAFGCGSLAADGPASRQRVRAYAHWRSRLRKDHLCATPAASSAARVLSGPF